MSHPDPLKKIGQIYKTWTPQKKGLNSVVQERWPVSAPLVALVVLLLLNIWRQVMNEKSFIPVNTWLMRTKQEWSLIHAFLSFDLFFVLSSYKSNFFSKSTSASYTFFFVCVLLADLNKKILRNFCMILVILEIELCSLCMLKTLNTVSVKCRTAIKALCL